MKRVQGGETNTTLKQHSKLKVATCVYTQPHLVTNTDNTCIAHRYRREDNPVNNPFAIDVISLLSKRLKISERWKWIIKRNYSIVNSKVLMIRLKSTRRSRVNKHNTEMNQKEHMLIHTNEENITHKAWREVNPMKDPFAIDVISLPYNNLSVKGGMNKESHKSKRKQNS